MDKYIYFAAEMSLLKWGSEQFMSEASFLEEAQKWMSPADLTYLNEARIDRYDPHKTPGIYTDYLEFELTLREELARYRRAAKEGYDYKFVHIPPSLIKEGNPLENELNLMKYRWQWLEEREFAHYSDPDFFVLYFLKLQILQRAARLKQEAGEAAFSSLIASKTENSEGSGSGSRK
ncbi:MAG: DUF2764 family protein [Candidatus Marinimicrobia bacterium]|nr:DUF2764 family protein [Candidatus Neomarinimicrobiota bacterium]